MIELIPAATLPLSRWPNGAGRKADIRVGAGWMVGYAWLDADAPFSDLAGKDRTITLVEGPGFTLDVAGRQVPVLSRFAPARFDGGAPTACRIAGPSRVLNAMTDRALLTHSVQILDRSGPIDPAGRLACIVVALDGPARLGADARLEPLDAARVSAPAALVLSPGCRAACIMIGNAL